MNTFLLNRAIGSVSHQALAKAQNIRLLYSIQPAPHICLSHNGKGDNRAERTGDDDAHLTSVAHSAGVNSIAIDKFEGR